MDSLQLLVDQTQGFKNYLVSRFADSTSNLLVLEDMVDKYFTFICDFDKTTGGNWSSRWELVKNGVSLPHVLKNEDYQTALLSYLDSLALTVQREISQEAANLLEKSSIPSNLEILKQDLEQKEEQERLARIAREEIEKRWKPQRVQAYIKALKLLEAEPAFNQLPETEQSKIVSFFLNTARSEISQEEAGKRSLAQEHAEKIIARLTRYSRFTPQSITNLTNSTADFISAERGELEQFPPPDTLELASYIETQIKSSDPNTLPVELRHLSNFELSILSESASTSLFELGLRPTKNMTNDEARSVYNRTNQIYSYHFRQKLSPLLFNQFLNFLREPKQRATLQKALSSVVSSATRGLSGFQPAAKGFVSGILGSLSQIRFFPMFRGFSGGFGTLGNIFSSVFNAGISGFFNLFSGISNSLLGSGAKTVAVRAIKKTGFAAFLSTPGLAVAALLAVVVLFTMGFAPFKSSVDLVDSTALLPLDTSDILQVDTGSQYIILTKTVTPDSFPDNNPGVVTYTIVVDSADPSRPLTNIKVVSDEFSVFGGASTLPSTPPIKDIVSGQPITFTVNLAQYRDSLISNTIVVTADAGDKIGETKSATATVIIGNPPTECFDFGGA